MPEPSSTGPGGVLHVVEPAASGRAKCRGCGEPIAKAELRFGERLPNPYGEGEMTLWFHLACGAFKRPEPFLQALERPESRAAVATLEQAEIDRLRAVAQTGAAHRRLPRVDGAGRAPTGRARCRACRAKIDKDAWRIGLVYYEEGFFNPAGFIHAGCARDYLTDGGDDAAGPLRREAVIAAVAHFSPELTADDLAAIGAELGLTTTPELR
jgi:hypothetical protein